MERKVSMQPPPVLPALTRRVVLGMALATGLAFASWQQPSLVQAADTEPAASAPAASAPTASTPAASAPAESRNGGSDSSDLDIVISPHGVKVAPNSGDDDKRIDIHPGHVTVQGFGRDRQYDSFEQFMRDAPGTALFAFLIVTVVFLVPLLAIALLVWYKIRRTRMQHEAMLKLAERGVVSPSAAMEALAGGSSPAATIDSLARAAAASAPGAGGAAAGANAPLYEQARLLRRRTAWSDLRKGVILIAVGLGLSAYSMFDDGTPNGAGLIVLFLGVGYCVLWYFQDRAPTGPNQTPPTPPGAA
jgi:hypothetical protein